MQLCGHWILSVIDTGNVDCLLCICLMKGVLLEDSMTKTTFEHNVRLVLIIVVLNKLLKCANDFCG